MGEGKAVIQGECVTVESREGYAGEATSEAGGRSDSEARSSPARSAAEGHALLPHEELPGKWETYVRELAKGSSYAEARARAGISAEKAVELAGRKETAERVVFLVRQRVRLEAGRAAETVSTLLSANSERVRLEAALALLDRSGVSEATTGSSPVSIVIDLSGRGEGG